MAGGIACAQQQHAHRAVADERCALEGEGGSSMAAIAVNQDRVQPGKAQEYLALAKEVKQ